MPRRRSARLAEKPIVTYHAEQNEDEIETETETEINYGPMNTEEPLIPKHNRKPLIGTKCIIMVAAIITVLCIMSLPINAIQLGSFPTRHAILRLRVGGLV